MNLLEIRSEVRDALLSREQCIGFVVHRGKTAWLIDWADHFTLDQQKNIDAMCRDERYRRFLPAGLTPQQWKEKLQREFRDGIPTLTADLFPSYRDGTSAKVVSTDLLRDEFFIEDAGQYASLSNAIEDELSFNTPMSEEFVELRLRLSSKLPKFYVNYDREIFMHMVRGRSYETVVLDGWWGAECDFEHMIPTSCRYWVRDLSEDYWAITNFRDG